MKDIELRLIRELMRNSRQNDRELARHLGVSQPTISRRRAILEKQGIIEYTGVPNLQKLGFEVIAITFGNWNHEKFPDTRISAAKEFAEQHHNLVFLSSGRGLGSDRVAISVHENFSDYISFIKEVKADWGKYMDITGTFLISLSTDEPLKSMTFKYLADYLQKKENKPISNLKTSRQQ